MAPKQHARGMEQHGARKFHASHGSRTNRGAFTPQPRDTATGLNKLKSMIRQTKRLLGRVRATSMSNTVSYTHLRAHET